MTNKIIKGIAASQGIVKGIVRVIKNAENSKEFQEGDILVAEMTEPSMVMIMNMASGIVTDRGGITSHAAIVSRELGIPCVTSTYVGTKELKDGMRVEVDGEKGEIRILD